jgi:hypothetical protein
MKDCGLVAWPQTSDRIMILSAPVTERIDAGANRIGRAGEASMAHRLNVFRRRPGAFNFIDQWLAGRARRGRYL